MIKIGQSTDIHQLQKGLPLILGGVLIEHPLGLKGHSDADVLTHAIIESIIGALGLGDIGSHFPDTDPKFHNISSLILLKETRQLMNSLGYKIGNVDSLVLLEAPHLAPYISAMRTNIASSLNCDISQINIKATRGEKLGFIGKEEGIMAQAVVLLERI